MFVGRPRFLVLTGGRFFFFDRDIKNITTWYVAVGCYYVAGSYYSGTFHGRIKLQAVDKTWKGKERIGRGVERHSKPTTTIYPFWDNIENSRYLIDTVS